MARIREMYVIDDTMHIVPNGAASLPDSGLSEGGVPPIGGKNGAAGPSTMECSRGAGDGSAVPSSLSRAPAPTLPSRDMATITKLLEDAHVEAAATAAATAAAASKVSNLQAELKEEYARVRARVTEEVEIRLSALEPQVEERCRFADDCEYGLQRPSIDVRQWSTTPPPPAGVHHFISTYAAVQQSFEGLFSSFNSVAALCSPGSDHMTRYTNMSTRAREKYTRIVHLHCWMVARQRPTSDLIDYYF